MGLVSSLASNEIPEPMKSMKATRRGILALAAGATFSAKASISLFASLTFLARSSAVTLAILIHGPTNTLLHFLQVAEIGVFAQQFEHLLD